MGPLRESRYPTVSELVFSARALAVQWPGLCVLRQVGTSRGGRPLHLLSVGRARDAVLVVAGAHANEPAGNGTLLSLARRALLERELRDGVSWHFLLCADPDGASLHVTPAPRSLYDYHLGFFRPAGPEQPEWAPSVLPADRLPPETRALTGVIDELRPFLQVSLHGTDLGGSWVQLTRDVPGLAEPFAKSAAELHIPVETGASDAAGWPASGPGVHVMPAPEAAPAYPSLSDDARHSTWYHAHRYGGLTAVVEVPMWASDLVDAPAPHPAPDTAMHALAERLLRDTGEVRHVLEDVRPGPPPPRPAVRCCGRPPGCWSWCRDWPPTWSAPRRRTAPEPTSAAWTPSRAGCRCGRRRCCGGPCGTPTPRRRPAWTAWWPTGATPSPPASAPAGSRSPTRWNTSPARWWRRRGRRGWG